MGYFAFAYHKTKDLHYRIDLYRKIAFFYMKKHDIIFSKEDQNLIWKICEQVKYVPRDPLVWIASVFYTVYMSRNRHRLNRSRALGVFSIHTRQQFSNIFGVNKEYLSPMSKFLKRKYEVLEKL